MNYIINPSWFYWLGVVNSMRGFMLTAFIVAIIVIGVALIIIPVNVKLIRDYPFRCFRCRSLFEMTEEEKLDNDWQFDSRPNKDDLRAEGYRPRNGSAYFNCPVCDKVSFPKKCDMRKVAIMVDGTEINC